MQGLQHWMNAKSTGPSYSCWENSRSAVSRQSNSASVGKLCGFGPLADLQAGLGLEWLSGMGRFWNSIVLDRRSMKTPGSKKIVPAVDLPSEVQRIQITNSMGWILPLACRQALRWKLIFVFQTASKASAPLMESARRLRSTAVH